MRSVLLPAVAPLSKLQYVADPWAMTTWSEADLATLADSPVAANLVGVRGGFRLTPGAITILKRIPNLGLLGCVVGSDESLISLKDLPVLNWLALMAPAGNTHSFEAAGWNAITSLKTLVALELQGIALNPAAAKKLAAMKFSNTQHLALADCPGALEHLVELKSNNSIREMTFRGALTDEDLSRFYPLAHLRSLTLWTHNATLSRASVEKLSERLPQCKIDWNGVTFGPKDVNRLGAETLLKHNFTLTVRMPDGKETVLKPTDSLPASPFSITQVAARKGEPLAEDFVPKVFLPAIKFLPKLELLYDHWFATRWSDADVAELAAAPVAAHLKYFSGRFELNPANLESLTRFTNLDGIGCLIGDAVPWDSLSKLAKLNWISLKAAEKSRGAIPPEGWKAIIERIYTNFAIEGIAIDEVASRRLAELKLTPNASMTLANCPGARQHFSTIAKNRTIQRLNWYELNSSDADLVALESFVHLRALEIWHQSGTKSAVESLSRKLPNCRIEWNSLTFGPAKK